MTRNRTDQQKVEQYTRALMETARKEGRPNAALVQWQHAVKFTPEVLETLATMADQGDIALVKDVAAEYKSLLDQQDATVSVTVTTAVSMDDKLRAAVKAKAVELLGAPVYLVERVDPAIIGGIVVEARGYRYDVSVRAQLSAIRKSLSSVYIESEQ